MNELKQISRTAQNITDTYLRAISNDELKAEISAMYMVVNSDLDSTTKTSWISKYIGEKAKVVSVQTGVDYSDVLDLVKQQFIINAINNGDKDSAFIKATVKYSAMYVQSVLFSDLSKKRELIKGQAFINEDDLQPTSVEITINATKRALAEDLVDSLFSRRDQKAFIISVLTKGKEATKVDYGYSEKRINERLKKVEETLQNAYEKGDATYLKAIFGEIIETAVYDVEDEMTDDDMLNELYQNTTHQQSFYF